MSFLNVKAGTAIDIRYCTMNDPGKLGLFINGARSQDVIFSYTHTWSSTYATNTGNVTVPAGASIKLQYDSGGAGANIDFIQVR